MVVLVPLRRFRFELQVQNLFLAGMVPCRGTLGSSTDKILCRLDGLSFFDPILFWLLSALMIIFWQRIVGAVRKKLEVLLFCV